MSEKQDVRGQNGEERKEVISEEERQYIETAAVLLHRYVVARDELARHIGHDTRWQRALSEFEFSG